jgi:hypothetical protein
VDRKAVVGIVLASFSLMHIFSAQAQNQPINIDGGLQERVVSIGRDKTFRNLTVTMTLENKGKNTFYLLLLHGHGYPSAVDNAGASFWYQSGGGIAPCPSLSMLSCIGVPDVNAETPPLQAWTELDPGDPPITLTFALSAYPSESHGAMASFSCILAYRLVNDPKRDADLTEKEKRQKIQTKNISSQLILINQES